MVPGQKNICAYCASNNLVKNGHSENNTQRLRCRSCGKSFQISYTYNARKPAIKEQIIELKRKQKGVREIGRILKINKNTVIAELREYPK